MDWLKDVKEKRGRAEIDSKESLKAYNREFERVTPMVLRVLEDVAKYHWGTGFWPFRGYSIGIAKDYGGHVCRAAKGDGEIQVRFVTGETIRDGVNSWTTRRFFEISWREGWLSQKTNDTSEQELKTAFKRFLGG